MGKIEARLKELGIILPEPHPPVGRYLGSKRCGDMLFVSGRKSGLAGAVGVDVSEDEARQAARETVIDILAIVREDIKDLDLLEGVLKLQGFIRSGEHFTRQPYVLDGASDLLIDVFGENGQHARTATGVFQLPFGATIQLDMILQMK